MRFDLGYLVFLLLRPHGMLAYFKIPVYYLQMQSIVQTISWGRTIGEVVMKLSSLANIQVITSIL